MTGALKGIGNLHVSDSSIPCPTLRVVWGGGVVRNDWCIKGYR